MGYIEESTVFAVSSSEYSSYIEVWMDRRGDTKPVRPARYIMASELGFYGYNDSESDPILI